MKDLNVGRLINTVALGSFTVSIGGCLGGGSSSSDGQQERVELVAADWCDAFESCDPDQFAENFSGTDQCEQYLLDDYADALADYGADCASAAVEMYDCVASAHASLCDVAAAFAECGAEVERYREDCYEYDSDAY